MSKNFKSLIQNIVNFLWILSYLGEKEVPASDDDNKNDDILMEFDYTDGEEEEDKKELNYWDLMITKKQPQSSHLDVHNLHPVNDNDIVNGGDKTIILASWSRQGRPRLPKRKKPTLLYKTKTGINKKS